jgi:hypothetical protein
MYKGYVRLFKMGRYLCFQMCLCGLSDCDRRVAHGELVGVQMLMEDVLLGSCHVIRKASTEWQAALDNAQVFLARGLQSGWCCTVLKNLLIFRDRLGGCLTHLSQ